MLNVWQRSNAGPMRGLLKPLRLTRGKTFVRYVRSRGFVMIEGNTRIVKHGMELFISVREATVTGSLTGTHSDAELLQRACNKLLYARGLAAVPLAKAQRLLIATATPITG